MTVTGCHDYAVRVYYEDTDAGGVVYHANYLRFAERARTEALRAMGLPHAALVAENGCMLMVRRVEVDYLRPAWLDEALVVTTTALSVGGASMRLCQIVRGPAGDCAVLRVDLVCVSAEPGQIAVRPARLPPPWRAALAAMAAAGVDGEIAQGRKGQRAKKAWGRA